MLGALHKLRGLAALAVVFSHLARWHSAAETVWQLRLTSMGEQAVAIFFVISGFIMTRVHWAEMGDSSRLGSFLVKRAMRIYPCYWFYSLIFVFLCRYGIVTWDSSVAVARTPGQTMGAILLIPIFGCHSGYLAPSWSLFYEIIFYLVFALFFFGRRVGIAGFAVYIAISLANRQLSVVPIFCLTKLNVLFLLGMMISLRPELLDPVRRPWLLLGAGTVSFIANAYLHTGIYSVASAITALLLVSGAVLVDRQKRAAPSAEPGPLGSSLLWLGTVSYSLYLCHAPVQSVVVTLLGPPGRSILSAIAMVLAPVAVAGVSFQLVELPAQRLARHWVRRRPHPIPAAATG